MHKFNLIDLFCGAGGLSLGFELSGKFKIQAAIDNWEPAIQTFRYNHPTIPQDRILCDDVQKISQKNIQEKWMSDFNISQNEVDVIVGGPPCQGLSLAGKRLANDPRNSLFLSFVHFVEIFKPKVFVMENVPGLVSAEGGKIFNAILKSFHDIGYNHFHKHMPQTLKAENYGVPQARRRLFFIGFREDIDYSSLIWPPHVTNRDISRKNNSLLSFAKSNSKLEPIVTVGQAISDLPQIKSGEGKDEMDYPLETIYLSNYQKYMRNWSTCPDKNRSQKIYNHEAPNHTEKMLEMIMVAQPGKSVDPKYADSKKWDPKRPSFTVKALGAGGGSTNRRAFHYNPETPRGSTVRENARIQSFPDWYRFVGPKTHQMTQVGNAVPPLLARAIAYVVAEVLEKL